MSEISVIEALNQIQSWLNAGEYDKVIQGCQEVLGLEPGNQRALSLLKQAEEKRHGQHVQVAKPASEAAPVPSYDPLAHLEVEKTASTAMEHASKSEEKSEKRKLFLAMLVPAVLVVLIGGSAIWWLSNRNREDTIQANILTNLPEDQSYLEENEQRLNDLTTIATVLEAYKVENGSYPSADKIEGALAQSDLVENIPSDPRQGEIDKAGQAFGYVYAVYDGIGGENSVYVLSALFEDSKGFGYSWSKGAPTKNYPDYRDYEEGNVTFIGGDEDAVEDIVTEFEESGEAEEKPSGPQVNPDNQ